MIYYTSASGQIIGGTAGSDLTGISSLAPGADYAIFVDDATVSSLNPNNAPGTYSFTNVVAGPVYSVPTATGTLTFTEQPAADQLSAAQQAQTSLLRKGYANTLASGFQFAIGTTTYTFGWSTDDKTNLLATQESITDGFIAFPIGYADIHGNPVTIPDQTTLTGLKSKASSFFSAQHQQILTLIGNVQSATSVSAVQAITWTAATY